MRRPREHPTHHPPPPSQRDELRIMLKANSLSYHRPGDRHSNQMQNKREMAQMLLTMLLTGNPLKVRTATFYRSFWRGLWRVFWR